MRERKEEIKKREENLWDAFPSLIMANYPVLRC